MKIAAFVLFLFFLIRRIYIWYVNRPRWTMEVLDPSPLKKGDLYYRPNGEVIKIMECSGNTIIVFGLIKNNTEVAQHQPGTTNAG